MHDRTVQPVYQGYNCNIFFLMNYVCFKLYVYVLPTVPYSVDQIHVFYRFTDEFYLLHPPPSSHCIHPCVLTLFVWQIPYCKGFTIFLFFSLFSIIERVIERRVGICLKTYIIWDIQGVPRNMTVVNILKCLLP